MKKYLIIIGSTFINITSLISFYMESKSFKSALIKTMPIVIICLLMAILCMYIDYRKLTKENEYIKNELKTEKDKNKALVHQYNNKKRTLEFIEKLWYSLNIVFLNTMNTTQKDRFSQAYELYLTYTRYIDEHEEDYHE